VFYACGGDYNINLLQCDASHEIASCLNSVISSAWFTNLHDWGNRQLPCLTTFIKTT